MRHLVSLFLFSLFAATAHAESMRNKWMSADGFKPRSECNGFLYRPKRSGVPIYESPDTSSQVFAKLELGQRVCVVGERQGFAILEWRSPSENASTETDDVDSSSLAFARLVDLWEPRDKPSTTTGPAGFFNRMKQYLRFMMQGGVPDTPIISPGVPRTDSSSSNMNDESSGCQLKQAPKEQACGSK